MQTHETLKHTTWDCKYHVVFITKCRKKTLYGQIRRELRPVFRELAQQKECDIIEGNYLQLVLALFIGFLLQSMFLPCLCQVGVAKMMCALVFDGLVVVRMLIALLCRETGRGWIVYVVLCYTSVVWIEVATYWVVGRC